MSDTSQGPGWWQASDGKWYPPEQAPGAQAPPSAGEQAGATAQPDQSQWGQQAPAPDPAQGSPSTKKPNATRNVLIGVGVVFLLFGGGCAALLFAGGAALDEVVESINEELESGGTESGGTESGDDVEGESATDGPIEDFDASCRYAGTDPMFDDMQVEVTFTNPLGEVNSFELTYALLDGEGGTRFLTDDISFSQLNYFPGENEQFRVTLDAREGVPPNIDESTIACTVLEIERERFDLGGFERASDGDTCDVVGVDSSGRIDVELTVTSPYDETTKVQTWWALQAPGPVRFDADTEVTDLVGAGETYTINPSFGVEKPDWVGDDEITCTVLGFWDQGR